MSQRNCSHCGFLNMPQAVSCGECGFPLAPSKNTDKFDKWIDDDPQEVISLKNHLAMLGEREFMLYIPHIQDTFTFSRHLILILGRSPRCVTPVDRVMDLSEFLDAKHFGVSRRHAAISYWNGKYTIQDLGSSNGTKLNDSLIKPQEKYQLHDGDVIILGTLLVIFRCHKASQHSEISEKLADTK